MKVEKLFYFAIFAAGGCGLGLFRCDADPGAYRHAVPDCGSYGDSPSDRHTAANGDPYASTYGDSYASTYGDARTAQ